MNWNDDRMDRFAEQVDKRFDKFEHHVDARFNRLEDRFEKRFDALQHSMIYSLAGILAFAVVVVTASF